MLEVNGVDIHEQLLEADNFVLYRGTQEKSNTPLLIKIITLDSLNGADPEHIRHEFSILRLFRSDYITTAYSHHQEQQNHIILLEDIGAIPLSTHPQGLHSDLSSFLQLALLLTQALAVIHARKVIHNAFTPDNIVYNAKRSHLQVIDFSKAHTRHHHHENLRQEPEAHPITLRELPFCSPERIGRGNSPVTPRSDLYSLGIILYQFLTGTSPVKGTNQLELVHAHIAQKPVPPHEVNRNIPLPLSRVIMKLLDKYPDERYQTCTTLRLDLSRCLKELQTNGHISPFEPGSPGPIISESAPKLFGREAALNQLYHAYSKIQDSPLFLSVTGASGTGKTALVQQFKDSIAHEPHFFLTGKFDQYRRDTPYTSFIECLRELTRILLIKDQQQLEQWQIKILAELKTNAQVVIDVIPELEYIIGKQSPVPVLDPAETKARFEACLCQFIRVCSTAEEPLVLFLDDMQWTDTATLNLLDIFFNDQSIDSLFVICAFRDDEILQDSPLSLFLKNLPKKTVKTLNIALNDLSQSQLQEYLTHHLPGVPELVDTIAKISMEKTNGNPFFLQQFLHSLFRHNHIWFDPDSNLWQFDQAQVSEENISDNVANLILARSNDLDNSCREMLQILSCMGSSFDLDTICLICNQDQDSIYRQLSAIIEEGFLLEISNAQSYAVDPHQTHNDCTQKGTPLSKSYKFAHDQIQQAIYLKLPTRKKKRLHLEIGRRLKRLLAGQSHDANIYTIVDHTNQGRELIDENQERWQLGALNLQAGRKALTTAAYDAASHFFAIGRQLFGFKGWLDENYSVTLELHLGGAEAYYLNGDYKGMRRLVTRVEEYAANQLDVIRVYEIEIQALTANNKLNEAVDKSLHALRLLNFEIPLHPNKLTLVLAYIKTRLLLAGKKPEDLLNLPKMSSPNKQAIMRILYRMGTPAYYKGADFLGLIACKTMQLTLKYGNTSHAAAVGYAAFSIMQCGVVGDINNGYANGLVALKLQNRFVPQSILPASQYLFANLIQHWKQHLSQTLEPLCEAHQVALEIGETEQAGLALYSYNNRLYLLGRRLHVVSAEMINAREVLQQIGQEIMTFRQCVALQAVENLRASTSIASVFSGDYYDETAMVPKHIASGDQTTLFQLHILKMIQAYLLGDYVFALETEQHVLKYIKSALSSAFLPQLYFISSLARLALYNNSKNKSTLLRQVKANQKKLKRWAKYAPMNFLHLYELVQAERERCCGNKQKAGALYEKAINNAKKHNFLQNEAMGCELAGLFHLDQKQSFIGTCYLRHAFSLYSRWGAGAKTQQMRTLFPGVSGNSFENSDTSTVGVTNGKHAELSSKQLTQLDMLTMVKASHALATEIQLENYLSSMLGIMIENAGAEKGFLFLKEGQRWMAKTKGIITSGNLTFTHYSTGDPADLFPSSIIYYVARTQKNVILENAALHSTYSRDSYIGINKTKSVFCCPIISRDEVISVLFLENNLMTGAFSPERVQLLEHLGYQAALSMRNSILYAELEKAVSRMEQEIKDHQHTQQQLLHSEKLSAMGKISASIAHEIGNPILGIKFLLADIQKNEQLESKREQMIKVGVEECLRLQEMIRKLRHLYQPPSSKKELCCVESLVENALLFYNKHLEKNNITLKTDYRPGLPYVEGVKDQITQVMTNLILNAVDAMKPDGGMLSISTGRCAKQIYISFSDTGKGIAQEEQPKIFDPFFSSKPAVEGAGLGLSVSYGIVAKHKGTLAVDSTLGKGTHFVMTLPPKDDEYEHKSIVL